MGGGKPATLSGSSGKVLKGTLLKVRFRELTEVYYPNLKFEPPPHPDAIYPLEAGTLHIPRYQASEAIKEQWIYVFELKHSRKQAAGYVSLAGEFWADKNGKYQQVAWGKSTRNEYIGKDERPKGAAKESTLIHWEGEIYVCASRFPLSSDRLKLYLKSPDLVNKRCQRLSLDSEYPGLSGKPYPPDMGSPPPGGLRIDAGRKNTYEFFLINRGKILLGLHEMYQNALDEYSRHVGDEAKAEERLLSSLTLSTARSYIKAKSWNTEAHLTEIDLKKVRSDQWALHKDIIVAQKKREWYGGRLGWGMREPAFIELRNDWWAADEEAKAHWIELEGSLAKDLYQSDSGREYVVWAADQKDNIFEKLVVSHGETGVRAFKIARKSAQTINAARDILINFAVLKVGAAKRIREAYQYFLPNTFKIFDIPLEEIGITFIKERKTIRGTLNGMGKVMYDLDMRFDLRSVELSEKARLMMPNLVLLVNLVNLTYEMRSLQGKKSGAQVYGQIAAIGAAASATMGSLREIYGKSTRVFAVVAGVLEAVSQGFYAYDAAKSGKDIRAIAYGITAGAALMIMAGFTTVVGVMGVILYVLGQVLLAIFTSTPLEEWFEKCKWGTRFPGNTKYPVSEQLKDLIVLVGEPKVDIQLSKKDGIAKAKYRNEAVYVGLIIRPSIFVATESKFRVQIKLSEFAGTLMETVEVPGEDDLLVYDQHGEVDQIIHNWEISQTNLQLLDSNFELEFAIQPKFLSSWKDFSKKGYGGQKYVDLGLQ